MSDEEQEQPSRRGTLIAMAVIVVAILGTLWITNRLGAVGHMQDCVMAGRSNCAPVHAH